MQSSSALAPRCPPGEYAAKELHFIWIADLAESPGPLRRKGEPQLEDRRVMSVIDDLDFCVGEADLDRQRHVALLERKTARIDVSGSLAN